MGHQGPHSQEGFCLHFYCLGLACLLGDDWGLKRGFQGGCLWVRVVFLSFSFFLSLLPKLMSLVED